MALSQFVVVLSYFIVNRTFSPPLTYTSYFHTFQWTNDYFTALLDFDWKLTKGPGGEPQWEPKQKAGGQAPPKVSGWEVGLKVWNILTSHFL